MDEEGQKDGGSDAGSTAVHLECVGLETCSTRPGRTKEKADIITFFRLNTCQMADKQYDTKQGAYLVQ